MRRQRELELRPRAPRPRRARGAPRARPRSSRARRARRPAMPVTSSTPMRRPARSLAHAAARRRRAGRGTCCRSGSSPAITESSSAQSRTVRPNGPIWSSDDAKAISAVARDDAVGRLEADDAAERGRLADRAAGVGAERERREPRRDRRGRATARAARHARRVPRVARRTVGRVLGRRAHRELVHVELAERHEAGGLAATHDGRRVRRPVALEHAGARGGRHPARAQEILVADRARPGGRSARPRRCAPRRRACARRRRAGRRAARRRARRCARGRSSRPRRTRRSRAARRRAISSAVVRSGSMSAIRSTRRSVGRGSRRRPGRARARASPRAARTDAARPRRSGSRARAGCDVGGHVREVELRDAADVLEDAREIAQEAVDLVVGEADAGQAGGVQHVVAVESHRLGE